jgi:gliding motility-associated-like protein
MFVALHLKGQQRASVWYFGNHAGIDFSSGKAVVLEDGSIFAKAGCSSICNNQGQLLFYTNGNKVWNKNHQLMANGDTLKGSQLVNQNSVIVPKPLCDSLYYLFTINDYDSLRGFNYSIINMNKESGLGKIVEKNIEVTKNLLEKIAAIKHCNNLDYWIITHGYNNNFYVYKLDHNGFCFDTIKSKTGSSPKADIGYLKVSPAGNKIVMPINNDTVLAEVFDFNNKNGKISNPAQILQRNGNTYCYGIEFSPDGNLLYISTGGKKYELIQYQINNNSTEELNNSAVVIAEGNNFALQLAPDGKIYIANENRPTLNSINKPSLVGEACGFEEKSIEFDNGISLMGLPNFVQTWFYQADFDYKNTCLADSTLFSFYQNENYDSILWDIDTQRELEPISLDAPEVSYIFQDTGTYQVELNAWHCGISDIVVKQIRIYPYPIINLPADTGICKNCSLVLDAGAGFDSYLWNTGETNRFLSVFDEGWYYVEVSKNSCFSGDSILVSEVEPIISLPNAFTPNGDGLNDYFKIVNPQKVVGFHMWIHDRRGSIVYDSNNPYQGWDGLSAGKICYGQTYVWYVEYNYFDENNIEINKKQRGLVSIIR